MLKDNVFGKIRICIAIDEEEESNTNKKWENLIKLFQKTQELCARFYILNASNLAIKNILSGTSNPYI